MLGLQEVIGRPMRQLSLGERMKCELAAALLHRPKVLFLDEPTIGLDVTAQAAIRDFIKAYNKAFDATILMTSHYMADVTALASRVMVIDVGSQVFDGDLSALVERHSPDKILRIRVQGVARVADFARFGVVRRSEGSDVELAVPRNEVVRRASEILTSVPIIDIGIEEPSIEDVIRTVFRGRTSEGEASA